MADITDGEVELEGYYRRQIELKTMVRLAADDLTEMLLGLDDDHKRYVLDELAKDPALVGELFERLDDDEQVDVANDHMDLDQVNQLLQKFSDGDREELFGEFCCHCGKYVGSSRCHCMNDD